MRILLVGSRLCARALFGQPLPLASTYVGPKGYSKYSYRGALPYQFMPIPGVYHRLQRTALSATAEPKRYRVRRLVDSR
jgi:hypothetical protein